MQRHMPMGYRITDGRAEIVPEAAQIVKLIFSDYLDGTSTYRIARDLTAQGVLNASHKPSWNHGTVGKILENQKYRGDGFYPPLIEAEVFDRVQERRRVRAESLGRTAQLNSFANKSLLGGVMVCGICGQPYRKYVEHCNQPGETVRWKCKHYIKGNRVYCRNISLTEEQIETACLAAIHSFIANPGKLEQTVWQKQEPETAASRKLTGQIQARLESGWYSADEIRQLVFDRAREQYRVSHIDDYDYHTQKLKTVLAGNGYQAEFDPLLFQQTIRKIMVYEDGRLRIDLINGASLDINID